MITVPPFLNVSWKHSEVKAGAEQWTSWFLRLTLKRDLKPETWCNMEKIHKECMCYVFLCRHGNSPMHFIRRWPFLGCHIQQVTWSWFQHLRSPRGSFIHPLFLTPRDSRCTRTVFKCWLKRKTRIRSADHGCVIFWVTAAWGEKRRENCWINWSKLNPLELDYFKTMGGGRRRKQLLANVQPNKKAIDISFAC